MAHLMHHGRQELLTRRLQLLAEGLQAHGDHAVHGVHNQQLSVAHGARGGLRAPLVVECPPDLVAQQPELEKHLRGLQPLVSPGARMCHGGLSHGGIIERRPREQRLGRVSQAGDQSIEEAGYIVADRLIAPAVVERLGHSRSEPALQDERPLVLQEQGCPAQGRPLCLLLCERCRVPAWSSAPCLGAGLLIVRCHTPSLAGPRGAASAPWGTGAHSRACAFPVYRSPSSCWAVGRVPVLAG